MDKSPPTVQPGGLVKGSLNKMLALAGLSWFSFMVISRYVIKPIRTENRMKENEVLMNYLHEEQVKQKANINENYDF